MAESKGSSRGLLDLIERIGNALPDPAMLFVWGAVIVMVLSQVGSSLAWEVQPKRLAPVMEPVLGPDGAPVVDAQTGKPTMAPALDASGKPRMELVDDTARNNGQPYRARSLLSANGLYWAISSMVDNFINFPPLGVVLVGMLGIGVAERTGFIGAALKAMMLVVPNRLLTPTMIFLGIMSSAGVDSGYIVLPPVAAALYASVGRSPLAGIAAVFAGVAAGFNANLLVTGLDPMLANLTTAGARAIEPELAVAPTCNWYFMIASTFIITLVGWATSDLIVERRLSRRGADEGGPSGRLDADTSARSLTRTEVRGLIAGAVVVLVGTGLLVASAKMPGWPFDDRLGRIGAEPGLARGGDVFDRWVESIVPMLFCLFLAPGLAFGVVTGKLRRGADVARLMVESMASMAPIIVLSFFAAQFIEYFKYSNLDKMLAYTGGELLASSGLGTAPLLVAFVLLTALFNLFVGSMSAKYSMFAPIFVPMLMLVGISPELTQAAYRIGDSTTNVITPLNAYLVIILVVIQKYVPRAGMGTLISMMVPYSLVFTATWIVLLLAWLLIGLPLGPGTSLTYPAS